MNSKTVVIIVAFLLACLSYGTSFLEDYNTIKDNVLFAVLYISFLTTIGYFIGVYLLQDKPKKSKKKKEEKIHEI